MPWDRRSDPFGYTRPENAATRWQTYPSAPGNPGKHATYIPQSMGEMVVNENRDKPPSKEENDV
jgi:hypothetical protein